MRVAGFDWDSRNIRHIRKHSVTQEEVEGVFLSNPYIRRGKGKKRKYYAYSLISSGRYLFTVFYFKSGGIIRPISSRDMEDKERKLYKRKRR